ncbi:tripartite tricarboxylate transporter substrate binding protein [Verticiella sediminum]|uniref:Tripartite tricarboxylate transporter substrate binding protein n=1 Tax=Verticiella sediminum TaxID=1247510 RepID=A0A556B2Y5_9BURK|nr:tripartite tricarboxylate transporter substrate binding protein [Verticiella sediminum]TSH99195.1 tripartite tricarboxylate transporter substrate binding protein [Verticiella sediminum]
MKSLLHTAALAAALLCAGTAQAADTAAYPARPISVIVPFDPGGGIDVLVRAVGAELAQRWGQPFVVENRPGAGSLIGASAVARARPDGYTLLATVNQTMVGNRYLFKNLPYDPDKDFVPITMMVRADQLVVANAGLPADTLEDALQLARDKPGSLSFGSFGNGSQPHLLFETINEREKLDLLHIPYKGITPNLTALAAGEVNLGSGSVAVVQPLIDAGKIKPLAVAGDERVAQFPDVSTTTEQGLPYVKTSIWYALFAPAGTPPEIVDKLRNGIKEVLDDPDFAEKHATSKGLAVVVGDGEQLRATIAADNASTAEMVKAAGVTPE